MELQNTTLDDIAGVIGFTPTLRLSAWFGAGNNLYVPEVVEDGQILVRLLGRPNAERLAAAFPCEHLAIPRLTVYEEESRRLRVALMLSSGHSTRQVASFERMSERRIQQLCRELETAGLIAPIGGPGKNQPGESPGKNPRGKTPGKNAGKKPAGKTGGKKA